MTAKNKNTEPLVVIVGRKNVGKSSLFNRLIEKNKALISDVAGTTRDVNYGDCFWRGENFLLADTAGLDIAKKNDLEEKSAKQALKTIKKADLVVFLIDGQVGILADDRLVLKKIRKTNKPIILVANKIDSQKIRKKIDQDDFHKLGLGPAYYISAASGIGTGDLLDKINKIIKPSSNFSEKINKIKIAIIGKPNAGKSSLLNKLLGEEEVITSAQPQTTLEPQERELVFDKTPLVLIDTAGIKKWTSKLERIIIDKSIKALERANLALLILDIGQKITKQDLRLAGLIDDKQKPNIIIANKIDLLDSLEQSARNQLIRYIQSTLSPLRWSPIILVSAKTGMGINKILKLAIEIYQKNNLTLDEKELKIFIRKVIAIHKPAQAKGNYRPKIIDFRQTKSLPLEFSLIIGKNDTIHFSYLRYIENRLREQFQLSGIPLKIKVITATARPLLSKSRQGRR